MEKEETLTQATRELHGSAPTQAHRRLFHSDDFLLAFRTVARACKKIAPKVNTSLSRGMQCIHAPEQVKMVWS